MVQVFKMSILREWIENGTNGIENANIVGGPLILRNVSTSHRKSLVQYWLIRHKSLKQSTTKNIVDFGFMVILSFSGFSVFFQKSIFLG